MIGKEKDDKSIDGLQLAMAISCAFIFIVFAILLYLQDWH